MIWREYFDLLEDAEDRSVEIEPCCYGGCKALGDEESWWYEPASKICVGEYGMPAGYLDLLLVSKQVSTEAREVLWTTTTFEFRSFEDLMSFLLMKRHVDIGRRQSPLYPGQLLRHIDLQIWWDQMDSISSNMLYLVECF
jgi:hypothetical protein